MSVINDLVSLYEEPKIPEKEQKKKSSHILRLRIGTKLIFGFIPLAILTVITAVWTLNRFEKLNAINESIITQDQVILKTTEEMLNIVLAEELYGSRLLILQDLEMFSLLEKKSYEFNELLVELKNLAYIGDDHINEIDAMHRAYVSTYQESMNNGFANATTTDHSALIKKEQSALINKIKVLNHDARIRRDQKTDQTAEISAQAFRTIALLSALIIIFGFGIALLITQNISKSIKKLKAATKDISAGRYDNDFTIGNHDELGELSYELSDMARRLKVLEEMHLDASPLTHLPGGSAIETVLSNRLEKHAPLAFCLVDIDNFKAYNDSYGYSNGNDFIKKLARIIEESVRSYGEPENFIGHIGGDDFAIITTPDKAKNICEEIIREFDASVPKFYTSEDVRNGFIEAKSRQGTLMKFPLMSVSIAVVTNQHRHFENHICIGEIAAELKTLAKSKTGSIFVFDRRKGIA